jgi:hypothetical protein
MVVAAGSPRSRFWVRLATAACLALLLVYAIAAWSTVQGLGGADRYLRKADFLIVITGAAILGEGEPARLYDEVAQARVQASILHDAGFSALTLLPFNHPPFEALLVASLRSAGLSYAAILGLWTLLSVLSIVAALVMLLRAWPDARPRGLIILAAFTFFPLGAGLLLGQSTAFVFLGWAGFMAAQHRGHNGRAGVACALAALKPQSVPVILLALLLTRRWRALAAFVAVTGAATVAVMPLLGADWPVRYLSFLLRYAGAPEGPAAPAIEQNWQGLFRALLGNTRLLPLLVAGASLVSVALVVWLWLGRSGRRSNAGPGFTTNFDLRWVFTLLAALLVNPHLLPHDLTLAIVPGIVLLTEAQLRRDRRLLAWLWLGWAFGFAAVLYRGPLPSPAPLWLAITGAWLLWSRQCRSYPGMGAETG